MRRARKYNERSATAFPQQQNLTESGVHLSYYLCVFFPLRNFTSKNAPNPSAGITNNGVFFLPAVFPPRFFVLLPPTTTTSSSDVLKTDYTFVASDGLRPAASADAPDRAIRSDVLPRQRRRRRPYRTHKERRAPITSGRRAERAVGGEEERSAGTGSPGRPETGGKGPR